MINPIKAPLVSVVGGLIAKVIVANFAKIESDWSFIGCSWDSNPYNGIDAAKFQSVGARTTRDLDSLRDYHYWVVLSFFLRATTSGGSGKPCRGPFAKA